MRTLKYKSGFTLIELLIVMAIISILLTLAVPNFFSSIDKSKEAALKYNLSVMRDAIDKYNADKGEYPTSLELLVNAQYLKKVPLDTITDSTETWEPVMNVSSGANKLFDVKSGAKGISLKGEKYSEW